MEGFFGSETLKSVKRIPTITGCGSCGLHKDCKSPKMKSAGKGEKGILIIGACPSDKADSRNDPFVGASMQMLQQVLRKSGINMERDCVLMNALACNTDENEITTEQINSCRPNVFNTIKKMQPKMIIPLGIQAVESLIGHRFNKGIDSITKWRGWTIPDRDLKSWVCPIHNPAYVQYMSEKNISVETVFKRDVRNLIKMLDKPLPEYEEESRCIEIIDGRHLYDYLKRLNRSELSEIAFDYETTGLKPHRTGHRIVTCAIAEDENICKAFVMPTNAPTLQVLKDLLANPNVPKIAQNMKFEDIWTAVILGVQVQGWKWDTMLVSHMQDNRKSISGLKFQAYVRFGIVDYDSEVSDYLKAVDDKDANAFNRVLEAPLQPLLYYNGMDSLLEYRLHKLQDFQLNAGGSK